MYWLTIPLPGLQRLLGPGLLAFALAFGTASFPAQTAFSRSEPEDTEAQARQLLAVINTGEPATMREFVRSHFSERVLRETPVDELVALLQKMKLQSDGLEVIKVLPPEMENQANLLLRTRRANHFLRLVVFSRDGKLVDFAPLAATDPEGDISTNWPTNKASRARICREIERHADFAASRDLFSGVVLVADGDRICFQKAYGLAEKSFQSPNRLDTKFNLGSLDKMFTGVAIAQLVAARKLSFDDKLAAVLPDYPNPTVAGKVTIHQLLTHTSGLGDALKPEVREKKKKFVALLDFFPLFVNDPLLFEPGSKWSYSNAGYVVLGVVIERISGQSYFDYVREHVFLPAGMNQTGYFELDQVVPNLAVGYGRFEDDVLGVGPRRNNAVFLGYKGNSAGGGYSTAPDLLRFARALRGYHLLPPGLTERVTTGKVSAADGRYGYGFWQWQRLPHVDVRGNSGGGANCGINSEFRLFWNGPFTVIVMSNYDAPSATSLAREISEFLSHQSL
jgi:CubicO group peptidase (beta-lactamase class C family)